jgi:hypothetical protein
MNNPFVLIYTSTPYLLTPTFISLSVTIEASIYVLRVMV